MRRVSPRRCRGPTASRSKAVPRHSWQDTARIFGTSWDTGRAVAMAVDWGRARQPGTALGVDEIAWQAGHRYLTLVYQLDAGRRRLLWVGEERKIETLERFFQWFHRPRRGLAGGLLRHVEGLPDRDPQARRAGPARARPLPSPASSAR